MFLRLSLFLSLVCPGLRGAEPVEESIVVDGRTRTYLVSAPAPAAERVPLVIVLHGSGGDAARMVRSTAFHTLGAEKGFLVVYPNGYEKNWNDGRDIPSWPAHREKVDDIAFLSALMDRMVVQRNADAARIFVTGISNGGLMSHRVGCELAGKVAAIAPVVRTITAKMAASCRPQQPVSVLMFFGTADKLVPFEGGKQVMAGNFAVETLSADKTIQHWAAKNGCRGESTRTDASAGGRKVTHVTAGGCRAAVDAYILHGAGHSWPPSATAVIWQFFASQARR